MMMTATMDLRTSQPAPLTYPLVARAKTRLNHVEEAAEQAFLLFVVLGLQQQGAERGAERERVERREQTEIAIVTANC